MLHGRQAECALLRSLVRGATEARSSALVIRGEAGVGKSALLAFAAREAGEVRVLRGVGVEAEMELPYAVLHQLLHPVLSRLEVLPEPQAGALRGAFGLGPGRGEDRFLVAVATLSVLADVAGDTGLLCLVDDAQWCDRPSAEALVFVARRLQAEGIALVFAARGDDDARSFPAVGLPQMELRGLDPRPAAALLAENCPGIARPVADQLISRTAGNPLALRELPALLTSAQVAGRQPLPEPLPLGRRLERVFSAAATGLPAETRELLVLAAADETGELDVLFSAAARLHLDPRALEAAERAGLVVAADGRIRFRHPLIRSAVHQGASFELRRAVHLALAGALDAPHHADRRAWHRAAVAAGPDPQLADELEAAARRARHRSGPAAAAAALERSAALTADEPVRGARLLAAADAAWAAGGPASAVGLLDRAAPLLAAAGRRSAAARLRGVIQLRCGLPERAYQLLMESARMSAPEDPHAALESLVLAGEAASFTGDIAGAVAVGRLAAGLVGIEKPEDRLTVAMLSGVADTMSGHWERGARRLRVVVAASGTSMDPLALLRAGRAALYLGDEAAALAVHARAVDLARQAGAVSHLPVALDRLAFSDVLAGRLTDAAIAAEEGQRLADEIGQQEARAHHLVSLALVAAWRGEEDACSAHARTAGTMAERRSLRLVSTASAWALGLLDLGMGRPDRALERLLAVVDGRDVTHPAIQIWATPDLVEAAVRSGRADCATAAAQRYDRWAARTGVASAAAVALRCRALLEQPGNAEAVFDEALRRHVAGNRPHETARTQLVYGEALRRARRRTDSRMHLRAALEGFERLGARPWAERARAELRATGETTCPRAQGAPQRLTPQELQVARLAAAGRTNPVIAEQLFLSRRTVEYHLHKVFIKLGIASRAELGRLPLE